MLPGFNTSYEFTFQQSRGLRPAYIYGKNNLVIDSYLVKYESDTEYDLEQNDILRYESFSGDIRAYDLNGTYLYSVHFENGKSVKNTFFTKCDDHDYVISAVYIVADWPWICDLCGYYFVTSTQYIELIARFVAGACMIANIVQIVQIRALSQEEVEVEEVVHKTLSMQLHIRILHFRKLIMLILSGQ